MTKEELCKCKIFLLATGVPFYFCVDVTYHELIKIMKDQYPSELKSIKKGMNPCKL